MTPPSPPSKVEQLTIGAAIRMLRRLPVDHLVVLEDGRSTGAVSSYRGYYNQLALEPRVGEPCTVGYLTGVLDGAWGSTFTGYKGGDYVMGGRTPLWVAEWGDMSGRMLTRILCRVGTDLVILKTDEEAW